MQNTKLYKHFIKLYFFYGKKNNNNKKNQNNRNSNEQNIIIQLFYKYIQRLFWTGCNECENVNCFYICHAC